MGRGKTSKSHDWKTIFKLKNLMRARKRKWLSRISKIVEIPESSIFGSLPCYSTMRRNLRISKVFINIMPKGLRIYLFWVIGYFYC
jgi:hypothetical protein